MRPVLGWRLAEKAESQGQPSSRAMIAESVVRGKEDFLHENFRLTRPRRAMCTTCRGLRNSMALRAKALGGWGSRASFTATAALR